MFLIMLLLQANVFNARATVNKESIKEKLVKAEYGEGRKRTSPNVFGEVRFRPSPYSALSFGAQFESL